MAITHINYRNNGGGEKEQSRFDQSPMAALESLCVFELSYGGQITALTETSVEVKTNIMGCRDRTVFNGNAKEMRPLVLAAGAALFIMLQHREEIIKGAADTLDKMPESVKGLPLIIVNVAGFLLGRQPAMAAICAAAEINSEEEMELLRGLNFSQAMAVVRLRTATSSSLAQAASKVREAIDKGVKFNALSELTRYVDHKQLLTYDKLFDILIEAASQQVELKSQDLPAVLGLIADGSSIQEALLAAG